MPAISRFSLENFRGVWGDCPVYLRIEVGSSEQHYGNGGAGFSQRTMEEMYQASKARMLEEKQPSDEGKEIEHLALEAAVRDLLTYDEVLEMVGNGSILFDNLRKAYKELSE